MLKIGQNVVAGSWHNGHTNVENINSSKFWDGIGHCAQADCAQLDTALNAARSALKKWTTTALDARQTILMGTGNELIERWVELRTLLSREERKLLAQWVGEVFRAKQFFTFYAAGNPE